MFPANAWRGCWVCSNMVRRRKRFFWHFTRIGKQKGITPVGSEAGRQKAVLLVKENKELKKLFPDSLEEKVGEIYQMGEQYEKELKEAEQKAKREAEIAEHRKADEAAAALELECSKKYGRRQAHVLLSKDPRLHRPGNQISR